MAKKKKEKKLAALEALQGSTLSKQDSFIGLSFAW